MPEPQTFQEAILYFADRKRCIDYLALRRWPDGKVVCPTCGRDHAAFLAKQERWQCKSVHSHRQFSVKVGTVMEDSAIPLEKWLPAIWALVNDKNGISSWELHKAIGLHDAMYLIPVLDVALVAVLFAAARTVKGDYQRLQKRTEGKPG